MKQRPWAHYAFLVLILLLVGLSFYILSSYGTAIIFGLLFAFMLYPVYRRVSGWTGRPTITALALTILLAVLLTVPFVLMAQQLTADLNDVYIGARDRLQQSDFFGEECEGSESSICQILDVIDPYFDQQQVRQFISQGVSVMVNFLTASVRQLLLSIPLFLLNVLLMLIVLFYGLRDGHEWMEGLRNALPLSKRHTEKLFSYTDATLYAILYGQIVASLVQGALGGLGFWIFGVDNPVFWGLIMALLSVIPILGAWLIWVPAVAGLFIGGEMGAAIGLGLYSLIFVSLSDNIVRPYVVAGKGNIHPLVVLLGVFGGLSVFGISGFVLGPLIIALAIVFAKAFHTEFE